MKNKKLFDWWYGSGGGTPPSGDWLLITGFWDDNGVWDDTAFWID